MQRQQTSRPTKSDTTASTFSEPATNALHPEASIHQVIWAPGRLLADIKKLGRKRLRSASLV
jgi:hypothetical protein